MKEFILLYKGPATPMADMTSADSEKVMANWNEWTSKMGEALLDVGQPMANGITVTDDEQATGTTDLNGYSIIQAKDMDHARELVEDHPFLTESQGVFSIEIHELLPAPMEM